MTSHGQPPRRCIAGLRSIRTVLLLHPMELPIAACLLVVAVVFTISPTVLEHTPISFETRGPIHHAFHYLLLIGSALAVAGMLVAFPIRPGLVVGVGLFCIGSAVFVNVVALVSDGAPINGLSLGERVGLLIGIGVRIYIVIAEPIVIVRAGSDDG